MVRKSLFLMVVAFLLAGCATSSSTPAHSTPTRVLVGAKTHPSTATPSSTPIITNTPSANFRRQCLHVDKKETALKNVSSGVIFLDNDLLDIHYGLLDIQTGMKNKIPAQQGRSYGWGEISPDGKMFAYGEGINNAQSEHIGSILWVVDAHAGLLSKIPFNDYIGKPRWLSNERIILYTAQTDVDGSVMVVNPFTREQHIIANELPMLHTYNGAIPSTWRVEYSPDLEWVAYLYFDGVIVRDVIKKQIIWQSTGGSAGKPAWSSDSQQVAIVNLEDGQLYLINRAGQAKAVLPDGVSKNASYPSWSPDGQSIAFLNDDNLMLYSKANNEVTDLCFQGRLNSFNPFWPVWSPDSQQFFIPFEGLVDLQKRVVYTTQEITNSGISNWMNSLP
jgi:hypothetical protein